MGNPRNTSQANRFGFTDWVHQFPKAKVLVVGDFILDQFVWGSVDRISPEAPVPVVKVNRESYMPGGSLNVAHNIRSLGGRVFPCGLVGRDREGRMLVDIMRRSGIDTSGVLVDSKRPTSIKTRIIAHSQQVVRFDREKTEDISHDNLQRVAGFIRKKMKAVDVVVIEDYGKGMVQPELLKIILKMAKRFRKPVLVDPKEKHFRYYVGATLITPNRKEAYGGLEDPHAERYTVDQVGKRLLKKLKCEAVLMTLGEDGMALFEKKGGVTKVPTTAREVYDVSGAGDTVIATLALALAVGADKREAAILSNFAAGVVVGKLGTATVTPAELVRAISEYPLRAKMSKRS